MSKRTKILIITSSGGGGLLQAAIAKEQQEKKRDASIRIIKRDVLKDWYGKRIGAFSIRRWDRAQRAGDVATLKWLFDWQHFADRIFWPRLFYCSLRTLFQEDVDYIIDTQPLGTSAFLWAIRTFNFFRKKNLVLEKVIVDLPTDRNTHFFVPIKKLSHKNRSYLRLITIPPLLKEAQTAKEFWQEQCAFSEQLISYEYVVRNAFFRWKGVKRTEDPFTLSLHFENAEEKELLARSLSRGRLQAKTEGYKVHITIPPKDKMVTILLGSQPANSATLNYVRGFMEWVRKRKEPLHLFVFCTHHRSGENSLFSQVVQLVEKEQDYPEHFTVIPFGMQKDEAIAPLFHRSDITCTRSGGQTAMELMCVMHGEIWIHSETKGGDKAEPSLEELLKGIPGWEAGNALYLHKLFGAKIITPEIFLKQISC